MSNRCHEQAREILVKLDSKSEPVISYSGLSGATALHVLGETDINVLVLTLTKADGEPFVESGVLEQGIM